MKANRITTALTNWKRRLADRLPAPMAAPETPRRRYWRRVLIIQLGLLCVLTAAWEPLAGSELHVIAALMWVALALASLVIGPVWLIAKVRADRAWASRECGE